MRIFLKLRPKGVRLGPTDVLEPLFECLYSPFNLLQYFKDGVHRSKIENIPVSDPDSSSCFRYCFAYNFLFSYMYVPNSLFTPLPSPETSYACGSVKPLDPATIS